MIRTEGRFLKGFVFERCNLSVHILPISFSRSGFSTQLLTHWLLA
ncbi:hypothetical protein VCR12J2_1030115 [Vibrio coralliirubri]|nr:hypothetical protein VCR12J2_1030115 [Vibrio coralliirubri]